MAPLGGRPGPIVVELCAAANSHSRLGLESPTIDRLCAAAILSGENARLMALVCVVQAGYCPLQSPE
jgi:hypothetical protein